MQLRKPRVSDVPAMVHLMQPHILSERLLPRSERQVCESLREYTVAVGHDGAILGLASLRLVDLHLAEVGALASDDSDVKTRLLDHVLAEATEIGVQRAFVLTDDAEPFERRGFQRSTLAALPEKRDRQCLTCPRLARCRQVALEIRLSAAAA